MLLGASDLVTGASVAGCVLDLARRHWRARAVPSMTFPCWSSICLAAVLSSRRVGMLSTVVKYAQLIYPEGRAVEALDA
jgi:hypothetical protein